MKKKVIKLEGKTIWEFLEENKELNEEYMKGKVKSRLYWYKREWRYYFKKVTVIEPTLINKTPLDGLPY